MKFYICPTPDPTGNHSGKFLFTMQHSVWQKNVPISVTIFGGILYHHKILYRVSWSRLFMDLKAFWQQTVHETEEQRGAASVLPRRTLWAIYAISVGNLCETYMTLKYELMTSLYFVINEIECNFTVVEKIPVLRNNRERGVPPHLFNTAENPSFEHYDPESEVGPYSVCSWPVLVTYTQHGLF